MADHGKPWNDSDHDGRFGDQFDDEVNVRAVVWVTVGLAITTVVGFVIAYGMFLGSRGLSEASVEPASPVEAGLDRRIPDGPVLQAFPEKELREMRREMIASLNGYGWVDEGAGVVHIPIENAIEMALEQGLVATTPGEEPEVADAADAETESAESDSENEDSNSEDHDSDAQGAEGGHDA